MTQPDVFIAAQYSDQAILRILLSNGFTDFPSIRLIEVGCGSGSNLLRLLRWGFSPDNLVGSELLEERAAAARLVLPSHTRVIPGDARLIEDEEFDIVYQSTVFSSILDDHFQHELATKMWSLVRPGGAVLSYDFIYDNPANADVRKVPLRRLGELFPHGCVHAKRVTLAPPIGRRVARVRPVYALLNAVPALRSHVVALIQKPTIEQNS